MYKYKYIRATHEKFMKTNPIIPKDSIGYETDTKWMKIGDGVTHYNDLKYLNKPRTSYDIAKERGYVGSEEEWNDWVKVKFVEAQKAGFKGSIFDWELYLEPTSPYFEAVKLGFKGTPEEYYKGTITGISDHSWGSF